MSSTKLRQIVVDDHNYRALKELGQAGDSFNDVITQVLRIVKNEAELLTED
jgi:predicted CopG family antitoxin